MSIANTPDLEISQELLESVENFPSAREVAHCGQTFLISPLETYATCPGCGVRIKVRSFTAALEIEDLFDAFAEWLANPDAARIIHDRQQQLAED